MDLVDSTAQAPTLPNPHPIPRLHYLLSALAAGVVVDVVRTHPWFDHNDTRLAWLYATCTGLVAVWGFVSLTERKSVLAWFSTATLALMSGAVVFFAYRAAAYREEMSNPELYNFVVLVPVAAFLAGFVPVAIRDNVHTTKFLSTALRNYFGSLLRLPSAIGSASALPRFGSAQTWRSSVAGLLLSIPATAIIAALLSQDAQFSTATQYLVDKLGAAVAHAMCVAFVTAFAATFLMLFRAGAAADEPEQATPGARAPTAHLNHAAGENEESTFNTDTLFVAFFVPVAALFAIYASANLPTFFLSDASIHSRGGPTYAEHLHRGFYESVTASMLACSLIWAELALRSDRKTISRGIVWMQILLLALASIAVLSCGHRLFLYISAYGLTPKRVFVGFFVVCALGSFLLTSRKVVNRSQNRLSGELYFFYVALALCMGTFPYFLIAR
ncbi:MAG: DUF4173 domain-containing protein [Sandaracinaceae bacterium]|nr:DUF4173 domain-containing protein [Sandaracinaceae bacterium]